MNRKRNKAKEIKKQITVNRKRKICKSENPGTNGLERINMNNTNGADGTNGLERDEWT